MTGANHARWTGYFKTAEPRIGDELGTFVAAMRRAIARGKERPPIVHQIVHLIGASAPRELAVSAAAQQQEAERPCSSF